MGNTKRKKSDPSKNPLLAPAVITALIGLVGTLAGLYFNYQQNTLPIKITQTAEARIFSLTTAPTDSPQPVPTILPTNTSIPTPILISTPTPEQILILVSKFEPVNTVERDVSRFITDDLNQRLNLSFADFVVREYPAIVSEKNQAAGVAETNQATIIVWGNYTADFIEINIQIGNLDRFEHIVVNREDVEEASNLQVRIMDERQESIVQGILSSMIVLHMVDSNTYETIRDIAVLETIQTNLPETTTLSVSGFVAKYCVNYVTDPDKSLDNIGDALKLNGGNPILYAMRGAVKQKLGDLISAQQDIETATKLTSNNWGAALFLQANNQLFSGDLVTSITTMNEVIRLNSKDWWAYNIRGSDYLLLGDLSSARADFASAIVLEPTANFPYLYSSLVAIQEGRLEDAKVFLATALQKFPDPTYGEKIVYAFTGTKTDYPHLDALSSYGRLILGQYSEAIAIADNGIKTVPLPSLYFIKGTAQCNLKQYPEAEDSYTKGLEIDPNFGLLYLLRADVRTKLGNRDGAQSDLVLLQSTNQFALFAPYLQNTQPGALNCENLFATTP
jgi:tetratricopeptide (TPR) repeat protein